MDDELCWGCIYLKKGATCIWFECMHTKCGDILEEIGCEPQRSQKCMENHFKKYQISGTEKPQKQGNGER